MVDRTAERWEQALDEWLAPFLAPMGHKTRRRWAPVYVRGLLGPGERKSVQPMAARVAPADCDQLHHFISSPTWDSAPLETVLVHAADRLVGGPDAILVIDDTALPKKGTHSVGVARQYAGALGKRANCQTLVSLTLARGEVPVPLALRLFLPEAWTRDTDRLRRAGVPDAAQKPRAKTTLALAELDRLIAAGVRFGAVVMDAGYGISARFRRGLADRNLVWAAGIPKVQNVYSTAVELRWPPTSRGRPRKHPVPSEAPVSAEIALRGARRRRLTWRRGTKGPLRAAFAAKRVCPAEGAQLPNGWHAPGAEVWLVGERRASGERKYYLCNLPADTPLKAMAALIKARWVCEQAHQQMKEELGLDHFEGRSWTGLHRHALLTMIAFAFLQHLRLEQRRAARGKSGGKNPDRAAAAADTPCRPPCSPRAPRRPCAPAMPSMSRRDQPPPA
jgi:SRSO17 transposase